MDEAMTFSVQLLMSLICLVVSVPPPAAMCWHKSFMKWHFRNTRPVNQSWHEEGGGGDGCFYKDVPRLPRLCVSIRSSTSSSTMPSWRRVSAVTQRFQPISCGRFIMRWTDWILRPTPVRSKRSSGWRIHAGVCSLTVFTSGYNTARTVRTVHTVILYVLYLQYVQYILYLLYIEYLLSVLYVLHVLYVLYASLCTVRTVRTVYTVRTVCTVHRVRTICTVRTVWTVSWWWR